MKDLDIMSRDKRLRLAQCRGMELNRDELALYDRQIRLYGATAQIKYSIIFAFSIKACIRIRNSHIMLLCEWNQLAQEVCKNLILTGIGALSIVLIPSFTHSLRSEKWPTMFGDFEKAKCLLHDLNPRVACMFYLLDDPEVSSMQADHYLYVTFDRNIVYDHYFKSKSRGSTFSWIMQSETNFYLLNDFQKHAYKPSRYFCHINIVKS